MGVEQVDGQLTGPPASPTAPASDEIPSVRSAEAASVLLVEDPSVLLVEDPSEPLVESPSTLPEDPSACPGDPPFPAPPVVDPGFPPEEASAPPVEAPPAPPVLVEPPSAPLPVGAPPPPAEESPRALEVVAPPVEAPPVPPVDAPRVGSAGESPCELGSNRPPQAHKQAAMKSAPATLRKHPVRLHIESYLQDRAGMSSTAGPTARAQCSLTCPIAQRHGSHESHVASDQ